MVVDHVYHDQSLELVGPEIPHQISAFFAVDSVYWIQITSSYQVLKFYPAGKPFYRADQEGRSVQVYIVQHIQ